MNRIQSDQAGCSRVLGSRRTLSLDDRENRDVSYNAICTLVCEYRLLHSNVWTIVGSCLNLESENFFDD